MRTDTSQNKSLLYVFTVLSAGGFSDAFYLTYKHFSDAHLSCSIFGGCDLVTNSIYSTIFGIPIALLGSLYYLLLLILAIIAFREDGTNKAFFASRLTTIGLIVSSVLLYIQSSVLHAYCLYCLLSEVISASLFVTGFLILKRNGESLLKSGGKG